MPNEFPVYPMPVKGLLRHPEFIALPSAGRGMLFSLLLHFWSTELRPLPTADDRLCGIAQGHRPTWRTHKDAILRIFKDIRPDLEVYYKQRMTKTYGLRMAAISGHSTQRLNAAARKRAPSALALGVLPTPKLDAVQTERPPSPDQRPARRALRDSL
jgi:hypothetical protein